MRVMIYRLFSVALSLALFGAMAVAQVTDTGSQTQGAGQDMKDAGHSTKKAAKKTGHKAKHGAKKGTHKAAQKTSEGANKVQDKTQ
jgi:predicted small secreted protein